jgi:hypothetical protein
LPVSHFFFGLPGLLARDVLHSSTATMVTCLCESLSDVFSQQQLYNRRQGNFERGVLSQRSDPTLVTMSKACPRCVTYEFNYYCRSVSSEAVRPRRCALLLGHLWLQNVVPIKTNISPSHCALKGCSAPWAKAIFGFPGCHCGIPPEPQPETLSRLFSPLSLARARSAPWNRDL